MIENVPPGRFANVLFNQFLDCKYSACLRSLVTYMFVLGHFVTVIRYY